MTASPEGARTRRVAALGLVLFVAAGLRLHGLGQAPLSREEASSAAIAWGLARGEGAPPPSDPSWSHVSPLLASAQMVLFWLLGGGGEATARLPSALAGIALVAFPVLLRRRIGAETALCLAALVALDPVCVETSRRADGTAIGALLAAAALVGPLRGAALGLLLVAGSAAWTLLPVVALASFLDFGQRRGAALVRPVVAVAATAALLGASGLLGAWDLVGGVSASLTTWLGAWSSSAESARLYRLGVVPPLALGPGIIGLVYLARARRFAVVAALLAALAWTVRLAVRPGGDPAAALLAILILTAAAVPAVDAIRDPWVAGFSPGSPRTVGTVALLAVLALPGLVRTARVVAGFGGEAAPARSAGIRLLAADVERFSLERSGDAHELPVEVLCQPRPDPLLRWTLREARHVRFHSGSLDPRNSGPALVVGPDPSSVSEGPCEAPRGRAGARYRAGTSAMVMWVPLER